MTTEKLQPKLPSGQVMKWKEQDYPTIYVNMMGLGMTSFDIALVFGEIGDASPTEVTGIPKVKLLLSPEQASNLKSLLEVTLKNFVENNGPLRTSGAVNLEEIANQLNDKKVKLGNESRKKEI